MGMHFWFMENYIVCVIFIGHMKYFGSMQKPEQTTNRDTIIFFYWWCNIIINI